MGEGYRGESPERDIESLIETMEEMERMLAKLIETGSELDPDARAVRQTSDEPTSLVAVPRASELARIASTKWGELHGR